VQGPADLAGKRVCSQVDTTSLATVLPGRAKRQPYSPFELG